MGSDIQKVSPLSSTKTQIETAKRIESTSINIGDEMKRLSQVEIKMPTTPQEFAAIKLMIAMAYPEVSIDSITNLELHAKYLPQYLDGTLQKKIEATRPQRKEILATIKNEKRDPSEVANKLLDKRLALHNEGYEQLPDDQKVQLRNEAKLKFLKTLMPEKFGNLTPDKEQNAVKEFTTTIEALIYAFQAGKVSSKEDVEAILKEQHRIGELQYEWASAYFEEHPDELEKLETSDLTQENAPKRRMYTALQRGNLHNKILSANNIKDDEELHSSGRYIELEFAYLQDHEGELNNYERLELKTLRELHSKNHGDLSGIRNVAAGINNVDTSLTEQIIETDGVDIQSGDIEIKTKDDFTKFAIFIEQTKGRLKECSNEDELKACIQEIRGGAQSEREAQFLDKIMNHIMAEFSEEENNLLTPEFYINSLAEIGISPHMAMATSVMGNEKTQMAYTDIAASTDAMTNTQKGGYTQEVIPEFETSAAKLYSVNKMTDTGIQEVHDVLPETYAKFDEDTAQKAFEHAMNSSAVTDERKAIIARDTIDNTDNADLKKFYEDLANKYNVDYTSVPPKTERTNAPASKQTDNKPADNNNSNTKVSGTDYTQQEVANILAKTSEPQNVLSMAGKALQETLDIILGKTPENNLQTPIPTITSLNTAITQLKTGTKLNDVFRQSNNETKKELVEVICTYGKTAIAQLIDTFGGRTIYKLAKSDNARAFIKSELKRIALSDATQRGELAGINEDEEKDRMTPQKA